MKWEDRHRPAPLRNEGKPCGVIRNRWEAAVFGANPEIAVATSFPRLWQGTGSILLPSGRSQGVVRQAFLGAPAASITGGRVFEAQPLTMKRCAALFHQGGREVSAAPFLT